MHIKIEVNKKIATGHSTYDIFVVFRNVQNAEKHYKKYVMACFQLRFIATCT